MTRCFSIKFENFDDSKVAATSVLSFFFLFNIFLLKQIAVFDLVPILTTHLAQVRVQVDLLLQSELLSGL